MAVGEGDHRAVGGQISRTGDGIGGEARLGLLAVADHRGTGGFQPIGSAGIVMAQA
jgi:hypothetical protein